MDRIILLDQLIADTAQVKTDAQSFFELEDALLRQRPQPDRWSVLECIEHLNIADSHYLMQFDEKLGRAKRSEIREFEPGVLGRYFVNMIKPKADGTIPYRMKTFAKFRPEVDVHYDTKSRFLADQDKLISMLESAKTLDLNKNKITSAIGSLITFRLGDAFRFLIGHNQRHIVQAQNVLKELEISG